MSLIGEKLPVVALLGDFGAKKQGLEWDAPEDVLSRWLAFAPQAAAQDDAIDIFDVIGEDFWTGGGVTDKTVASALKGKSGRGIKVRINSPGGDVFAGLSIYNLLRAHAGKVTVEVTGIAASAASVIAMAADEIVMAEGSMLMIHNAWGMAVGNQHDFRETADVLEKIDNQLIGIYAARTGKKEADIGAMMKAETFLAGPEAVDAGFADRVDAAMKVAAMQKPDTAALKEKRRLERALGRLGVPRNKRPEIISLIADEPPRDAGLTPAERDAGKESEAVRLMTSLMDVFKV